MKLKVTNIKYEDDYKKVAPRNLSSSLLIELDEALGAAVNSPAMRDMAVSIALSQAIGDKAALAIITADIEIVP